MTTEITLSPPLYVQVLKYLKDKKVNYLEIGVFNGQGLAQIARQFPTIKCEAIDPYIDDGFTSNVSKVKAGGRIRQQYANTLKNIQGLNNVNLNVMTSREYYSKLTKDKIQELNIGVVLIDGNHNYHTVVLDFQLAMSVISTKQGIIVLDDIHLEDVAKAYDEFKKDNVRIEKVENLHPHPGVVIYLKELV